MNDEATSCKQQRAAKFGAVLRDAPFVYNRARPSSGETLNVSPSLLYHSYEYSNRADEFRESLRRFVISKCNCCIFHKYYN